VTPSARPSLPLDLYIRGPQLTTNALTPSDRLTAILTWFLMLDLICVHVDTCSYDHVVHH